MKDILGKNIEVGDHVVYIQSAAKRNFEEAMVTESEDFYIKIEYTGTGSETKSWVRRKKQGEKSKLTVTDKKIFVLDSNYYSSSNKDIYLEEIERFKKEEKKLQDSLAKVLEREAKLIEKNNLLAAEVNKIHSRFDILDL